LFEAIGPEMALHTTRLACCAPETVSEGALAHSGTETRFGSRQCARPTGSLVLPGAEYSDSASLRRGQVTPNLFWLAAKTQQPEDLYKFNVVQSVKGRTHASS